MSSVVIVVFNNPMPADTSTAVDGRELYISRCIGVPGDTLMLNSQLIAEGSDVFSPDTKALYSYPAEAEENVCDVLNSLGIKGNQLERESGAFTFISREKPQIVSFRSTG